MGARTTVLDLAYDPTKVAVALDALGQWRYGRQANRQRIVKGHSWDDPPCISTGGPNTKMLMEQNGKLTIVGPLCCD